MGAEISALIKARPDRDVGTISRGGAGLQAITLEEATRTRSKVSDHSKDHRRGRQRHNTMLHGEENGEFSRPLPGL